MGCGAPQPYEQLRGSPVVIVTRIDTTLSSRGFRLALAAQCQRQVIDLWCPRRTNTAYPVESGPARVACETPPTVRREPVVCPRELDFKSTQVSIRAPWGSVYRAMSDAHGIVEIPVDWSGTGVDPLAPGVAGELAAGWLVYSDEARAVPLKIDPGDVERMQVAIGAATDTQYDVGAANEKAILSAEFAEAPPLVLGRPGTLSLAITNRGPQPAYRVIAKLRSSLAALHGHQLSFGRIDPGKTKIKARAIAVPPKLDERSALVVADITYFNGDRLDTQKRFAIVPETKRVESPRGLALDCKLATDEVAPGERVRISCELRNLGGEAASELSVAVSVGGVVSKNLAPKELPGAGAAKLDLVGLTSASAKQGAQVPVIVRVGALGIPVIERTLTIRIATFATRCKTRLTRNEYKAKHKRLQTALESGALTQKEFDKYDADLVSCLE